MGLRFSLSYYKDVLYNFMFKNPITDTLFPLFPMRFFEVLMRSVVRVIGELFSLYMYSVACLRGSVEPSQPSTDSGE